MTQKTIEELFTGNEETDLLLGEAHELGLRQGRALDRENLQRSAKIDATRKLLAALMRSQSIDLQTAMVTLQIPRAERKTYKRIFANRLRK